MTGLLRNTLLGTIGGVAATLSNFVSSIVLARMLGADGSGAVAFVVWCGLAAATVCGLGLPLATTRYLPEMLERGGPANARAFTIFALKPIAAMSGGVALLLVVIALVPGLPARLFPGTPLEAPLLCIVLGLIVVTQTLGEFTRAYLRGSYNFSTVAALMTAVGMLQIVGAVVGSRFGGVDGALVAGLVPLALPLAVLWRMWPRGDADGAVPKKRVRHYAQFRWASEILGLLVWSRIEVVFLQSFWGSHSVGLFSVGLTLANMATQGPLMLTWALLPHLAQKIAQGDQEAVQRTYASGTRILAFILSPAAFGLAAILPSVVLLLYGAEFEAAATPATIIVVATGIAAISVVGTNLMWAMDRSDVDFYSGLIGAAVSLAGGLTLTRALGIDGAAVSRALTQIVCVSFSTGFLALRLHVRIPGSSLVRILASGLACGVAAHVTTRFLPGTAGIPVAIAIGVVTYFLAIRLSRPLQSEDWAQLEKLSAVLPRPLRTCSVGMMLMLGRQAEFTPESSR